MNQNLTKINFSLSIYFTKSFEKEEKLKGIQPEKIHQSNFADCCFY